MKYYSIGNSDFHSKSGKTLLLYYIIGFAVLMLSDYFFNTHEQILHLTIKNIILLGLLYLFSQHILSRKNNTYLEFDSDYVEIGFMNSKESVRLHRSEIHHIGIENNHITIRTEKKTHKIPLSNYIYTDIQEIKKEIMPQEVKRS